MFTLAISCLTTSNLPWFMDLTFQVPMQYCSLQHQTLLSPPDISMSGHHFHFGSGSSFLLELFLCSSAAVYWTPTNLGGSSFSVISFCLFILKRDGTPDHLTYLLRNLYTEQEATFTTGDETKDWFKTGKGVYQWCILSPCLFNFYAEYIMWNTELDESTRWNQDCWEKYQ